MRKICWNSASEFREDHGEEEKKTVYENLESRLEQLVKRVEKLEQEARKQKDLKRIKRLKRRVHSSVD